MNAAFVLLTSAMLGLHPAPAPCNNCSAPAPAVAACDSCGPTVGHSFGHKLRGLSLSGLFSCGSCKKEAACETPCAAPAPAPCPTPCPAPCEATPACGHGHSFGGGDLFGRFRGLFKHKSACDTCAAPAPACDSCGSAPAAAPAAAPATAPAPATNEAPKKMPDAPKTDAPAKELPKKVDAPKGDKAVRINETVEPAPLSIPTVSPVINTSRPAAIVAPATLRNPF